MRSKGPNESATTKVSRLRAFAEEMLDADGEWVEIDSPETEGTESTQVYASIGRLVSKVVYREGVVYGKMLDLK